MADTVEDERPPDSNDLPGWQLAVQNGSFRHYRLEAIVAAIQDLHATADSAFINTLARHLSDMMFSLLYRDLRGNHRVKTSLRRFTPSFGRQSYNRIPPMGEA